MREKALVAVEKWYDSLTTEKNGFPARGKIATALVVLERLKSDYDLSPSAHRTPGRGQVKGASGAAVSRILASFGETRPFVKEGGRTNRGGLGGVESLLSEFAKTQLDTADPAVRADALTAAQAYLVDRVRDYHSQRRIAFSYDPSQSAWQAIRDLLCEARETGKEGPVAQYLVGAKLQLRFPDVVVDNHSYSTADDQLDRPGDYYVGDTAFHVTVLPLAGVYERCRRNLADGFRVYLLVPEQWVSGARLSADAVAAGRIAVDSIESFTARNLDELSVFSQGRLASGFRRLLDMYNTRVGSVELDKSMLIQIPKNLSD